MLGPSPSGPEVAGGQAGVFLAVTSQDGDQLVSASAPGTASAVQILGGPVSLPAAGAGRPDRPGTQVVHDRADQPAPGRHRLVTLNFTFAEAGTIAMTVPVEPKAYEYATFSPPRRPRRRGGHAEAAKANPLAGASGSASASAGATAAPRPRRRRNRGSQPGPFGIKLVPNGLGGCDLRPLIRTCTPGRARSRCAAAGPGPRSILARSRLMCTSSVLVSPT